MSCKIFVGNLPWRVGIEELSSMLTEMGQAFRTAKVVLDRETGKSRGFGFVEFDDSKDAAEAVRVLDGHVFEGRPLRVSEAEDKPSRGGRGGGGRGGGSRSSGGRGGREGRRGYDGVWED